MRNVSLRIVILVMAALGLPAAALAQHDHDMAGMSSSWTVDFRGNVYLSANLQERKFTDFNQVESLNWFMAEAMRGGIAHGNLMLHAMISLEPFTVRDIGSAQVFQTGETYQRQALVDYQHPHDLLMAAGVTYEGPAMAATRLRFEAALVGAPALGPTPFMHRPSADANPTAPLSHHHLDSTHVSHGVLTAGVTHGSVRIEASGFYGREPDEDRIAVEFGPIDSYSARVSWRRGPWQMQVSGGHIKFPDPTEFTDVNRVTASLGYSGNLFGRKLEGLVAAGINREPQFDVTSPAVLAEGAWRKSDGETLYARVEVVDQDILTIGGYDPPGFFHPHVLSRIGAFTGGYERSLKRFGAHEISAGGDATVYYTPPNLQLNYGHPFSAHVYLRWRKR
jgi:hypothetical protein